MIYKSYLVEKKISLLKDGITLIYGENLGFQKKSMQLMVYMKVVITLEQVGHGAKIQMMV